MKSWSRKSMLVDLGLIGLCVVLFIVYGRTFEVAFACSLSFLYILLRKIDFQKYKWLRNLFLICVSIGLMLFVVVESLIISEMGTDDRNQAQVDYVIVLGSGLRGTKLSTTLQDRLDASLPYIRANPQVPVIVSGGQGPGEDIPEASAMEDYLIQNGIPKERILAERKSTSTKENLVYSQTLLREQGALGNKLMIVTSDFHMYRSKMLARKIGFEPYGISSSSPNHLKPTNMIREFLAMVKAVLF
ncbi:Uncharacterized SAM-binding protein YcdF, DUF218 family [Paenibacillus sp. cl6col]|uniref:YdcF family protein n=1 Tax=Paenibacillus TaxID=44249 RepID=UPI0003F93851|nr:MULTISPECIES: YdcF family protein [Paenibacillus]SDG17452.1 Uncharacterized SAM-binding protein YcdF, DUF218 family [Paenibacillus sp. cl6col]